jgi:hypothetical protein
LIIVGCFLLVWLVGYRIGYRSGISRRKRTATTTVPSNTYTATVTHVETENASGKTLRNSTGFSEEFRTPQTSTATTVPVETEHTNGKMLRDTPGLSEEFGTQQLFSYTVPYIKRLVYVE